jgi:hypothetical protein
MFVNVPGKRQSTQRWATFLLVLTCVTFFVVLTLSSASHEAAWAMRWGTVPALLFDHGGPWWRRMLV